jgi:hypothetical protein
MPVRRQSSDILYPFTPAAESGRALVKGIVDAMFIVRGAADTTVSGITTHVGYLYSVDVAVSSNTYVFKVEAPSTYQKTYTFEVPRGLGLAKVEADEDELVFLIVDSSNMADITTTETGLSLELEPSRLVWQLEEVRTIRLINEYRDADQTTRAQSITNNPDETILYLSSEENTLSLVDGYNCSLSYNEDTQTLNITGDIGAGKGLPTEFPWDSGGLAAITQTGIKTINGVNEAGEVQISFGESVAASYGTNSITLTVSDES